MLSPRLKNLYEATNKLLRWKATPRLHKVLARTRAEDLAVVLALFPPLQRAELFELVPDDEKKGLILTELGEDQARELLEGLANERVLLLLRPLSPDEQAYIFRLLPEARTQELLVTLKGEEGAQVEGLLRYPPDTAGGMMVPVFFAQREGTTAGEAIRALQSSGQDVDMPFYLYVINDYDQLVGVVSLRQLVVRQASTPLSEIMSTDVLSVRPETDQEEVSRIVARYNILAVPVVDESNRLLGICTVDDLIDVMQDEATEDILKMAGAGDEALDHPDVWRGVKARAPWLAVAMAGGLFAAMIIRQFESLLLALPLLAGFIPLILGMGGNVGTQSVTIVVRGLSTGRIDTHRLLRTSLTELTIGAILGGAAGLLIFGFVLFLGHEAGFGTALALGAVISLAAFLSMAGAAALGTGIPLLLAKLHLDPAVSTGPLVTSALDVLGLAIYFLLGSLLLPLLLPAVVG
ncbi:MAG: magnesium transporter [Myxococcota bacterium]|jgi:magnesium transporter|nr:magnesium transporter [Myxococcota bacterium]